jgi:hypothetical protein
MFVKLYGILLNNITIFERLNNNMYIVTKTQVRPNSTIPFYFETNSTSATVVDYLKENYSSSLLKVERNVLEDKLTLVTKTTWASRQELLKFVTDIKCYETLILPPMEYDMKNNIITVSNTTETKDN